jgi:hypothetical protein
MNRIRDRLNHTQGSTNRQELMSQYQENIHQSVQVTNQSRGRAICPRS